MATSQARLQERPIRYVKGVGPHRAGLLAQLDVISVEDVLYYPPRRYEDRSRLLPLKELRPGEVATVQATVLSRGVRRAGRGQSVVYASFSDGSGVIQGLWFHQPYLIQQLGIGQAFILYGRAEGRTHLQFVHPEMERVDGDSETSLHMGRIVPIYPLASGLSQRWLRGLIAAVLEQYAADLADPLPAPLRAAYGWPDLPTALRQLHFPDSWDTLKQAQRRLAFEELFLLQVALAQRRARTVAVAKPQRYQLDGPLTQAVRRALPFTLTASQERVLRELYADLSQSGPMHRLFQGDVGCGKTIVLVFLMAAAVQSGYQVALMAPTELLAEQHARVVGALLAPYGVSVGLLSQGVAAAQRRARLAEIASGRLSIVIGTHALIQRGVAFRDLALVIIDEQHKFGVSQRVALARKGARPDVLITTATPIPRTLALSLYGDLAVSTITELPPGRAGVRTLWMGESQREALYALIREELTRGRQGYVVYPLVQERAAHDLKAATQMEKRLHAEVFPDMTIRLLHGQMKSAQKERIMQQFVEGRIQLLVSTVIVEVGLDVPNATVMLIEHPERFGLAQLHQLRGRIGRSHHPATCVIVCDARDETIRQRLNAFIETADGFALAEKDLELRGPGELLGKRQHGWLRFRVASLSRDRALLASARDEALALVAREPELNGLSLDPLRERMASVRRQQDG